jgi:hypothetical protein
VKPEPTLYRPDPALKELESIYGIGKRQQQGPKFIYLYIDLTIT